MIEVDVADQAPVEVDPRVDVAAVGRMGTRRASGVAVRAQWQTDAGSRIGPT